jgi:hypothetical protein
MDSAPDRIRGRPRFGYRLEVHTFRTFTAVLAWMLIVAAFYQRPELLTGAQRFLQRGIEALGATLSRRLGDLGSSLSFGKLAV